MRTHWYQLTRSANVALGRSVRLRRLASGLTQRELGERCGVGFHFIGQMERGIGNPSLGTMAIVADALSCNVADLVSCASDNVITLNPEVVLRAQDALAVLRSVLPRRKR